MAKGEITAALAPGTVLLGGACTYRIERALGQGSFGITYLATTKVKVTGPLGEIETTTQVAVKEFFMKNVNGREGSTVTSGSQGGDYGKYRAKFVREAKHLSNLRHGRIVRVLESFEANNTAYYSMEYLDGGSLGDLIDRKHGLGADECLRYVRQIGEALSYMHANNMLHLDLKPGNVMLHGNGDAVLIDFGLSKQFDDDGNPLSSTTVGGGTPGYAPIEQAYYHGGGKGQLPFTMDVYALGATSYKMLTGERPPDASRVLSDPTLLSSGLSARHVPKPLSDMVLKAMSPKPKDRYQSVKELLAACGGRLTPHKEEPIEVTVVEKEESAEQMLARANKLYKEEKYSEAVPLYRKLAGRGNSGAQFWLGYCLSEGKGVRKNYSEAVKWYRNAAVQGNVRAQWNLGDFYEHGIGVSVDYFEAIKWYRLVAEAGFGVDFAQYKVGEFYERGLGVGKDLSKAKAWYGKAAEQGYSDAKKALERLSSSEPKPSTQKTLTNWRVTKLNLFPLLYVLVALGALLLYSVTPIPWSWEYLEKKYGLAPSVVTPLYSYSSGPHNYVLRMEQGGRGGVYYKPGGFWAVEPNFMRDNPEQIWNLYDDTFTIKGLRIKDQTENFALIECRDSVGLFYKGKQISPYGTRQFEYLGAEYSNGCVGVGNVIEWGLFNSDGKQIIPCEYDDVSFVAKDIIRTKEYNDGKDEVRFFDIDGTEIKDHFVITIEKYGKLIRIGLMLLYIAVAEVIAYFVVRYLRKK